MAAPVRNTGDPLRSVVGSNPTSPTRIRVEYDDGQKHDRGRSPLCTAKGRPMGMYVVLPDGTERPLNIGYMKVSEMAGLEELLNDLCR